MGPCWYCDGTGRVLVPWHDAPLERGYQIGVTAWRSKVAELRRRMNEKLEKTSQNESKTT